ncbi:cysteine desulfurase [Candidatus Saganbacteria bacterium]|nr:cysteine desulfurase [Candidatus Saganbacteria bacterium]
MNTKRSIYLDHMANTPVDARVVDAMMPHLRETYGNPLNVHDFGGKTADAIEEARSKAANMIGAIPKEMIFTSCGTESNNLAVRGIAKAYEKKGKHIISSQIEHFSVLYVLQELEKEGFSVTYLPVDKDGMIDPDSVSKAITSQTTLITLTHASNEIGTIEPIKEIGASLRRAESSRVKGQGVIFHIDAVQTAGTIPVNVNELGVDALTISPNQFYGPTGIAALYLRKGTRIVPQLRGGTQEEGKRSGTNNIPGIIGMGKACELAVLEMVDRGKKLIPMRDRLFAGLLEKLEDFFITGHRTNRLPGHVSGCVKFIEGESMSMFLNMDGIAVATGSACMSKTLKSSHVLLAIGVNPENIHGSLVFSFGNDNIPEDVDYVLEKLPPIVNRLREMSPLYRKGSK